MTELRLTLGWSGRNPMKLTSRNGKLWITFYHLLKRYKKTLNLDDTKANRKFATNNIMPEIQYKLNSGEFFNKEKEKIPTVGEFAKISFDIHKGHRKESSLNRMNSAYNKHIVPYFFDTRMDKIKPSHISTWQNTLLEKAKLSPKSVKSVRTILNVIFEDAVNDDIVLSNPVRKASRLPHHRPKEIKPFSIEEIQKILHTCKTQFRNFFAIGFFTGMRTGEIIGLQWDDIDFKDGIINIKRSIGKGMISTPKTQSSYREIEILPPLLPYLKDQFKVSGKKKSFVFLTSGDKNYFDSNKIRDYSWKRTLEEADIPYRTIYHMRHSFASMMISNGEDVLWVSHMLGHSTPDMTLKKYAKFIKNDKRKRATFLSNSF